jgi:hypothetical protein
MPISAGPQQTIRSRWLAIGLASAGMILILVSADWSAIRNWPLWCTLSGIALIGSGLILSGNMRRSVTGLRISDASSASTPEERLRLQTDAFEELKRQTITEFEQHAERLTRRERDLTERFAKYHEILEYPVQDVHAERTQSELLQLSASDREVHRVLEKEAERVYEKIRQNGYTIHGKPDVATIRNEIVELIHRIAKIYAPHSTSPLLETSFEQLARAASRVCLHVLVLVEQLPLNVQQYNFTDLYAWFRRAVVGYGAYKQAAPWLSWLTRGVYAGRIASASSPVTLGAWWLATEVGKQGAKKFVENVVDRQAIAVLHDLVNVVGVEVANVYGSGFRYRDQAWILGTELTRLISHFPLSRETLREGLQQITLLPLRNEYDRIYLYRCLASHKASNQSLPDPAILTREEREQIAARLEEFFAAYIHGAKPALVDSWRKGVEERLDLKLKLRADSRASSQQEHIESAVQQLAVFLVSVAGVQPDQVLTQIQPLKLYAMLSTDDAASLAARLPALIRDQRFEPPALDPDSAVTTAFLHDLTRCAVQVAGERLQQSDPAVHSNSGKRTEPDRQHDSGQLEELVTEIAAYFRQTPEATRKSLDAAWLAELQRYSGTHRLHPDLNSDIVRRILFHRNPHESVAFCYPELTVRQGESQESLRNAWLVGYREQTTEAERMLIVTPDILTPLWTAATTDGPANAVKITRQKGLLLDAAVINGGQWNRSDLQNSAAAIVISGSLRGGRYSTYFQPLIQSCSRSHG